MVVKREILKTRSAIFMQILLTVIATTAISFIPAYNKYLVDMLLVNSEFHLSELILVYCVTYGVFLVATWGAERFVWKSAIRFENGLKKKCFEKLTTMEYKDYAKKNHGEYLSMLTNQITQIEQDYLQPLVACVKSMISVLIYVFVIAYHTNWLICLVLLLLSILSGFSPKFYEQRLKKAGKEYVEGNAKYTKKVADILNGFELVTPKSAIKFQCKNSMITDSLSSKRMKLGHAKVDGNTISGAVVCLIDVFVFILCGYLFIQGNITVGVIVAALTYAQSFTEPVQEILYDINTINSSKDVVKSLEDFFAYHPMPSIVVEPKHNIEMRDVEIKYTDKTIKYNVAFDTNKKYVLRGASGLGKTTLLNILADRVAYEGGLYIDQQEAKIDENTLFYLSQNQHVFLEDFKQNVTLFETYELDLNNLDKQMKHINIYEQVKKAPDGTLLSGGEQQVLKMCRAWIQNKKILLLDEPFSAMDKETKKQMIRLLNESKAMIILITHDYHKEDYKNWEEICVEDIINAK